MKITYHIEVHSDEPIYSEKVEYDNLQKLEYRLRRLAKNDVEYSVFKTVITNDNKKEVYLIN